MSDGIYVALSGAVAQQRSLDVVANNVANANTIGYHGDHVAFRQALSQAGTQGPAPDTLRFNLVAQTVTNHDTGSLQQTGNPLDVALQGDAWFALRTPAGERYTRSGAFVTDRAGVLRSKDGHPCTRQTAEPKRTTTRDHHSSHLNRDSNQPGWGNLRHWTQRAFRNGRRSRGAALSDAFR